VFIYNEVVIEAPTGIVDKVKIDIIQALTDAGQHYLKKVGIKLSAEICDSWVEKTIKGNICYEIFRGCSTFKFQFDFIRFAKTFR
jgi:hypothetical protein